MGEISGKSGLNISQTMSTLQRAIEIATEVHQGQLDKAGRDYIGHPLRVMEIGKTEEEKIVEVLHIINIILPSALTNISG